jgi:hypothetical protein
MNINAKKVHSGQYKPYQDSFYVWEITTGSEDKDAVLDYCFENLYKQRVSESDEWHRRQGYGGDKSQDANYHFAGYYKLEKIDSGYKFTVCSPYTG